MIHANRIVTVGEQESIIDRPIVLYRGDREVEIEFTLVGNEFTFSEEGNVIKSVNASHGQLVLNTPSGEHMFSELAECHEGKVVFVVTKEMIDEFIEMGFYSFQIRLYDSAEMKSRVTIPPVMNGFDIRNPIAAEDETNVVDQGIVDYARIFKDQSNEELPTFDWTGAYNKTEWAHHDVITENKLNKIEDALYSINANIKESDVVMLNALDNVKKDADAYVKEHMAEVEADVDEFERNLNTGVEKFKVDTNASVEQFKINTNTSVEQFKIDVNSQLKRIDTFMVNVLDFGAVGDGKTDDTNAIQDALNFARDNASGIIYVPQGVFMIKTTLTIYSHTHLLLHDNAVIKRIRSGDMLLNGVKNGYEQYGDITIEGGTWDADNNHTSYSGGCHFSIGNCSNITIRNIRFLNNHGNHCLDLAGVENILIENCSFEGYWLNPNGERDFVEAIQLGEFTADGMPVFGGTFTNMPCKNVIIKNCVFKKGVNSKYQAPPCGIGHHGTGPLEDVLSNVTIRDCRFYDCSFYGIRPFSWSNALIDNCYFERCMEGLHITNIGINESDYYSGYKPCKDIKITNCYFNNIGKYDIWCYGKMDSSDINTNNQFNAYAKDILIQKCTFRNNTYTNGTCIYIAHIRNCDISSCYFDNIIRPIYYKACENMNVINNYMVNSLSEAVYSNYNTVGTSNILSHNVNISNNIIDSTARNGIFVMYTDGVSVQNNIVSNCSLGDNTRGGIIIASSTLNGIIMGNRIYGSNHAYDISITATCTNVKQFNNVCNIITDNGK